MQAKKNIEGFLALPTLNLQLPIYLLPCTHPTPSTNSSWDFGRDECVFCAFMRIWQTHAHPHEDVALCSKLIPHTNTHTHIHTHVIMLIDAHSRIKQQTSPSFAAQGHNTRTSWKQKQPRANSSASPRNTSGYHQKKHTDTQWPQNPCNTTTACAAHNTHTAGLSPCLSEKLLWGVCLCVRGNSRKKKKSVFCAIFMAAFRDLLGGHPAGNWQFNRWIRIAKWSLIQWHRKSRRV